MTLPKQFIAARRKWLRLPPPVQNARQNRTSAPTYDIELALDHLVSSIHGHVADRMTSGGWDTERFATSSLAELARLEEAAHSLGAEGDPLSEYIGATRTLLEQLQAVPAAHAEVVETSRRKSARLGVLAACQALLDGELGPLEAAKRIAALRLELDPDQQDPALLAFAGIESEEDHLISLDTEGSDSSPASVAHREERAAAESFHRGSAVKCAKDLIRRYSV